MTTKPMVALWVALTLASGMTAAVAQTADDARLDAIQRRLDALEHRPTGAAMAQLSTSERIDALERRLDALEQRLGAPSSPAPQARVPPPAAAPGQPGTTAAVQLPGGTIQQVPQQTVTNAATAAPPVPAARASYRALGLRKGMTEAEVVKLLGPPVKIRRGTVDVYFYSATSIEPNVNFQYGTVIGWND